MNITDDKKETTSTPHLVSVMVMAWLLMMLIPSCSSTPDDTSSKDSTLAAIDDSLLCHSHHTRPMVEKALKNAPDSISYYEYLSRLASCYVQSSTPDSAEALMKQTEAFAEGRTDKRSMILLAYAYNSRAGYYHNFHKHTDETISLYYKAYKLLMQCHDRMWAHNICANIADAYLYENHLPQAASWYRRALYLADSLHLPSKESASLYMGLAGIYQQLGDKKHALKLYKKVDSTFTVMPVAMQAYFLNNYSSYYYYAKDYQQSLDIFMRLKKLLERLGKHETFDMYLCKINLADVWLNLGNADEAEQLVKEVEPFWQKFGDPSALYYCSTIRLGIAVQRGDMIAAQSIIRSEKPSATVQQGLRNIHNLYLRRYYMKKGDWKNAYYNLVADKQANDSIEESLAGMRTADILSRYTQDTLRLHNTIAMEHKNVEMTTMKMWLVVVVLVLLLFLALFLLLGYRARRRRLDSQMQIMQLRLESARGQISPHFVFNVLNNQIADADKTEAARLLDLSKLIRANLDMTGTMTVTLAEELEFVNKYVRVERQLLVDDDFDFSVKVCDDVNAEEVRVPSMTIQIMVENAFVHGLKGLTGHKTLSVAVEKADGGWRVAVRDNGPGFDIRTYQGKRRKGINIIRQTLSIINRNNSRKLSFDLHNIKDAEGQVVGCESSLFVPNNVKYPK